MKMSDDSQRGSSEEYQGCALKLFRQWRQNLLCSLNEILSGFDDSVSRTLLCSIPNSSPEYWRIAGMIPNREPHPLCDHAPLLHALFSCDPCSWMRPLGLPVPFLNVFLYRLRRWHGRSKEPFLRLTLLSPQRCSKPLQFIFEVIHPTLLLQTNRKTFAAIMTPLAVDQYPRHGSPFDSSLHKS